MPRDPDKSKRRTFSAGQRVFDRFYLKRALGDGGTGVVWLAHDRVLEQEVALKFLADHLLEDTRAIERLKHETRRNLKLSHPNIVRIHDFLQDGNSAAIMMEYVEGWSLWTMKVDKPSQIFRIEEIQPWLRELCDALDYAHNQVGIVHRDLNPANLMLNARGQLKITDFGLARNIRRSPSKDFVDLRVVGTDLYMSPQQWFGEDPTVADDIYSIGSTIYELLTGKPPFYQGDILKQVQETVPPKMNERLAELGISGVVIPAAFEETVAACLAKDPAARPATVNDVAARLGLSEPIAPPLAETPAVAPEEIFVSPELEAGEPPPAPAPASEPSSRRWMALALAGAVAVALVAWLLIAQFSDARDGRATGAPGEFPRPDRPWQNSLGMRFVPVPGVGGLISIWETRLRDFKSYIAELGREPGNQMLSMDTSGAWRETGHSWKNPEFPQEETHPIVGVSWREAFAFCDWLTTRERAMGWIATNQSYRLLNSSEWKIAAGTNRFVWGNAWPPAEGTGNFAGEEIRPRLPALPFIAGYHDGYTGTAPVGSFRANAFGLFDLAGNVSEFCADRDLNDRAQRRWLVGGSWVDGVDRPLNVTNLSRIREVRRCSDIGFRVILEFRGQGAEAALED